MANEVFLSQKGYDDLEQKLDYLRAVKRHEVAEKIRIARDFGDISENAEYDAAKEEQAQVEGKIVEIEQQLKLAVIIDEKVDTSVVTPGCMVKIHDVDFNEDEEFRIVGVAEADLSKNMISNISPIGAGLLGRKKGETVEIETPAGVLTFKILGIRR
ncbi:MAG: transcription elongation factor GreA [Clostridia bacterium]